MFQLMIWCRCPVVGPPIDGQGDDLPCSVVVPLEAVGPVNDPPIGVRLLILQ